MAQCIPDFNLNVAEAGEPYYGIPNLRLDIQVHDVLPDLVFEEDFYTYVDRVIFVTKSLCCHAVYEYNWSTGKHDCTNCRKASGQSPEIIFDDDNFVRGGPHHWKLKTWGLYQDYMVETLNAIDYACFSSILEDYLHKFATWLHDAAQGNIAEEGKKREHVIMRRAKEAYGQAR